MTQPTRFVAVAGLLALSALAWSCSAYDLSRLESQHLPQSGAGAGGHGPDMNVDAGPLSADCTTTLTTQACLRPNADATCVSGQCLIAGCKAPYVDCDQNQDNGCETTLDAPEHCGSCDAACHFSHAAAGCNDGHCALGACDDGYADCDGDDSNGCETAVDSISNCGGCGHTCPAADHAVAGCVGGACAVTSCIGAFADCNNKLEDGCEEPLNSNTNCGTCGAACSLSNAGATSCANGSCVVSTCNKPFVDCNGQASDGCEARLDSPDNCSACGEKCSLPHVEHFTCSVPASGKATCGIDHGCAPDDTGCKAGAAANGCSKGFSDCDNNPANGCEVDLGSTVTDCSACKQSCVVDHTQRVCKAGQCSTTGCAAGYDRCSGSQTCQSLLTDPNHCGTCGTACGGATPNCAGGKCTSSNCGSGTADCDGDAGNLCEINLVVDRNNCGACGARCDHVPHANAAICQNGACRVGTCDTGWGDCDGDPLNGCETNLTTADDCGACGVSCDFPNALGTCRNNRCQMGACDPDRADCNHDASDGCEADLRLPSSCGACGTVCAQLASVVSSSCGANGCVLTCQAGHADCDGKADNGCEADLSDAHSCGACGKNCSGVGHVKSADCADGVCQNIQCDPSYFDCNGNPADGCERAINTTTDCGRCNQACAPAHATGTCGSGQCAIAKCDPGFGDCDGSAQNGCETALNTQTHCGACGTLCPSGSTCQNGMCGCGGAADCPTGLTCCSGVCTATAGQCFPWPCLPGTDLGQNRLNCSACGAVCPLWCCAVPVQ